MEDWRKIEFVVPILENRTVGNDFMIRGTAINETTTRNGVTYVAEELIVAAASLKDKPILKDHKNSVDSIVGRTTNNVIFNEMTKSIEFEGKIMDSSIKEKIRDGRIRSVSVGAFVEDIEKTETEDGEEQGIARGIDFVELSLVAVPADPNAGFSRAIAEALKLKEEGTEENFTKEEEKEIKEKAKKLVITTEEKQDYINQIKEDNNMSDEQVEKLRVEFKDELKAQKEEYNAQIEAIKEERLAELKEKYTSVTKERGLDSGSVDKFDAETLKTLISHLSAIPIKNEAEEETKEEEPAAEEPAKEEEPAAEEPVAEEEKKEEKMKDETKGFVGKKVNSNAPTGYVLERSGDFNGGIGFYKKFEEHAGNLKYERKYPWEGGN